MKQLNRITIALALLAGLLPAVTITQPGIWKWTIDGGEGQLYSVAFGTIEWDNRQYTVNTQGGFGFGYELGLVGFSGAIQDSTYPHRLNLVFNWFGQQVSAGRIERLVSFVPPGLGYLPYGHLYGGYWPDNIPRFLGDCEEPWYQQQQAYWSRLACEVDHCTGGDYGTGPGPDSGSSPVPEPSTGHTAAVAILVFFLLYLLIRLTRDDGHDDDDEDNTPVL